MKQWLARLAHSSIRRLGLVVCAMGRLPGGAYLRFLGLRSAADHALAAGDAATAAKLAEELLGLSARYSSDWYHGNGVHLAHVALGRSALLVGDLETARRELLLAARTPGSPQLNSFGPNMRLASELLALGEREVVLEYLDLCGKFWRSGSRQLARWSQDVADERMPDFGANLVY